MLSHCCSHGFFRRVLARSSFPLASSTTAPTTLWSARRLASSTGGVAAPVVDHYARLGVDDAATAADIKAAYRRRALQCHPDVVSEGTKKSAAEAEFRLVSESFQVLSDPSQRATLDEALLKSGRRSKKQAKEKQQARAAKMQAARASGAPTAQSAEDGERVSLRKPPVATPKRHTSSSSSSSAKRRSPFVRRDADRVFEEAFEGKSLQDILFSLEFERRHGNRSSSSRNSTKKAQQQQQSSAAGGVSDASSSSSSRPKNSPEEGLNRNDSNNNNHHPNTPAGSDEVLRRVLHTAAQQFAANVSRQYGPESLKHAKFIRTKPAAPPPSSKMTFRPFCNWNVPSGVETPATPSLGPVTSSDDPAVEVAKPLRPPKPMKGVMSEEMRNEMQRSSAIHRLHAETNRPHNLGQVYSYHRMY